MIRKILSIDDDEMTQFINTSTIRTLWPDVEVITANSGKEALDVLSTLEKSTEAPELVLLDLNMPEINGWEFLDLYKTNLQDKFSNFYIAVLSSTIDRNEIQRAEEHICVNRFVKKPLTHQALLSILDDFNASKSA